MVKKLFKSRLFFFILGISLTSIIGVGAASLIYSKDVTYDNTLSGLKSTTVQGALDELYEKAKNAPTCDSNGTCTVTCPNGKLFFSTNNGYKCNETSINDNIVTSGDGLYADTTEQERYIYRGTNPNNYIKFNNEMWRIISIESNGTFKIIKNDPLSDLYQWDADGNRHSGYSTYCKNASTYGCNAWATTQNVINKPNQIVFHYPSGSSYDTVSYYGTVTQDSSMATYLNNTYYNSFSSNTKKYITKGTFNVSTPGSFDGGTLESLEIDAQQEKQYQWQGYVALYTITELLRASTNPNCTNLYSSRTSGNCNNNNWLWPNNDEWTLSPYVDDYRSFIFTATSGGISTWGWANNSFKTRPVLHLSSDITLSGTGTSSEPYKLKN